MFHIKPIKLFFLFSLVLGSCNKEELSIGSLKLDLESAANGVKQSPTAQFVPGEVLVKFKKGKSTLGKGKAMALLKASLKEHVHTESMKKSGDDEGIFLLSVPEDAKSASTKAKALLEVEYAEPNWIYYHQAISNDPFFTSLTQNLWGMGASGNIYGIGASTAWSVGKTGSSDVFVGIIDEGYQFSHTDLVANAGKNPKEIAGNKRDDDRNGYVDDIYGWDFAGRNNSVYDGSKSKQNIDAHGTHVAGTIGGVGGNGLGVVGVCWKVKFISAKFLGASGGTTANAIKAVDYLTNLKKAGLNLVATNNSWGGGGYSQLLYDAINRANAEGILFIAAAGNDARNNDITQTYPANYDLPNVISVAAITSTGGLASFSNYGSTRVHLGAPGAGIISTVPFNRYTSYNGTSMATPHVTGAAALYKSINPSASAAQIKEAILNSVIATPSLSGTTSSGGRLNVSGF
jgi:subtilisin family serine protease